MGSRRPRGVDGDSSNQVREACRRAMIAGMSRCIRKLGAEGGRFLGNGDIDQLIEGNFLYNTNPKVPRGFGKMPHVKRH